MRKRTLLLVAVVAALAGGTFAVAQMPARQIAACVDKKGAGKGDVRIAAKCGNGERRVRWAKAGPQGEPGPQGEQGPPGPGGPRGEPGPAGPEAVTRCDLSSSGGDVFLKLEGIPGGSVRDGHEDEIDAGGFCIDGDSGGYGHVVIRSAPADPHSAPVFAALVAGTRIPTAAVAMRHTIEGETSDYLEYELTGVRVDAYRLIGQDVEELRLSWETAAVSHDGGPPVALRGPGRTPRSDLPGCPAVGLAADAFIDWPGLPGSSMRDGHEDEIDASRVCVDARRAYDGVASPTFSVIVGTGTDIATTGLLARFGDGSVAPAPVAIDLRRTVEGETSDFLTLTLTGTRIEAIVQRTRSHTAQLDATLRPASVTLATQGG